MNRMFDDYERRQLELIDVWERAQPSQLARAVGVLASPLAWATKQIVPDSLMEQALEKAFDAASILSGQADLLTEAGQLGVKVNAVEDLRNCSLAICDTLSTRVGTWAKGIGAAEGAATGMTGVLGLAADIPALMVLVIRTIREIGFCYGFNTATEAERPFVLSVLSAGAANNEREKAEAVARAMDLHARLDRPGTGQLSASDREIIGKGATTAVVRNLAKQLCMNLSKRKAAQVIPVVGGGIGAAMNVMFVTDVVDAAIRLYQKRRLEVQAADISNLPQK